ncbi:MAG: transposase [candidate division Zixibacteria bacterium]|nr:transposase [candidate division Zixibacteria bacterium]
MSRLLRHYSPGKVYFVTAVTLNREPILVDMFPAFWHSVEIAQIRQPFDLVAWAVMPDHVHMIIDPKDSDLSNLLRRIKLAFAYQYRSQCGLYSAKVWQARFWDHIIRDQEDMNRHIDYIHYNPVKHALAASPHKWRYSSFGRYVEDGYYAPDWGVRERLIFDGDFGE